MEKLIVSRKLPKFKPLAVQAITPLRPSHKTVYQKKTILNMTNDLSQTKKER